MEQHHKETIEAVKNVFLKDKDVLALILGGSIAHGYARTDSDVDIDIIVTDARFKKQEQEEQLTYFNDDLSTYEGGYVDGKYLTLSMLHTIAERGSDPARFAFKDCSILFSRIDKLGTLIESVTSFSEEHYAERRIKFTAQILAWQWYYKEGKKHNNRYLQHLAVHKLYLFTGRIILNENRMLYPFHKWLDKELLKAPRKPQNVLTDLSSLLSTTENIDIDTFCEKVFEYYNLDKNINWGHEFVTDSELNWIHHTPPVEDL